MIRTLVDTRMIRNIIGNPIKLPTAILPTDAKKSASSFSQLFTRRHLSLRTRKRTPSSFATNSPGHAFQTN